MAESTETPTASVVENTTTPPAKVADRKGKGRAVEAPVPVAENVEEKPEEGDSDLEDEEELEELEQPETHQEAYTMGSEALRAGLNEMAADYFSIALELLAEEAEGKGEELMDSDFAGEYHYRYGQALVRQLEGQSDPFLAAQERAGAAGGEEEGAEGDAGAEAPGGDDSEPTPVELAWEVLEVARVIYEKKFNEDQAAFAQRLADVLSTQGDLHLEDDPVKSEAVHQYTQALRIIETLVARFPNREDVLRGVAEIQYKLGVAWTWHCNSAESTIEGKEKAMEHSLEHLKKAKDALLKCGNAEEILELVQEIDARIESAQEEAEQREKEGVAEGEAPDVASVMETLLATMAGQAEAEAEEGSSSAPRTRIGFGGAGSSSSSSSTAAVFGGGSGSSAPVNTLQPKKAEPVTVLAPKKREAKAEASASTEEPSAKRAKQEE